MDADNEILRAGYLITYGVVYIEHNPKTGEERVINPKLVEVIRREQNPQVWGRSSLHDILLNIKLMELKFRKSKEDSE